MLRFLHCSLTVVKETFALLTGSSDFSMGCFSFTKSNASSWKSMLLLARMYDFCLVQEWCQGSAPRFADDSIDRSRCDRYVHHSPTSGVGACVRGPCGFEGYLETFSSKTKHDTE